MTMPILLLAQVNLRTGHGETVIEPMTHLLKKTSRSQGRRVGPRRRVWLA